MQKKIFRSFERFSNVVMRVTGKPVVSILAIFIIVAWLISGPFLNFSDTWQLIINTSTTVITFLMVFFIQQSQNKDTMAIQLKLNELLACQKRASNRLIDIEDLSNDELEVLKKFYIKLSELAKKDNDLHSSHSLDEAQTLHQSKKVI
ncbi:MAG TPA: low affinity iron permease family protein [Cyclobacteriaceae bacterium]|nr:low affinity iron permease family protein [Cyclobacteriaceae bacterium]